MRTPDDFPPEDPDLPPHPDPSFPPAESAAADDPSAPVERPAPSAEAAAATAAAALLPRPAFLTPATVDPPFVERLYFPYTAEELPVDPEAYALRGRPVESWPEPDDHIEQWEIRHDSSTPEELLWRHRTSEGAYWVASQKEARAHTLTVSARQLDDSYNALEWVLSNNNAADARLVDHLDQARRTSESAVTLTQIAAAEAAVAAGTSAFGKVTAAWSPEVIARRELEAEIALLLRISCGAAAQFLTQAQILSEDLPRTMALMRVGMLSLLHVRAIAKIAATVPKEAGAAFEEELLKTAPDDTVTTVKRKGGKIRDILHPRPLLDRTKEATANRNIRLDPAADGMAWLTAYLPAPEAYAIYTRLSLTGHTLQGPNETRTLTQLRADVFTDLCISGDTSTDSSGIRATVMISIPLLGLLGHTKELPTLEGYGPIDVDTARRLTVGADRYRRILTDPFTGVVVDVERRSRKISKPLRCCLRLRDVECTFIGCHTPAALCEVDHSVEWQHGGHTKAENLAFLCKPHHALKTQSKFRLSQPSGAGNLLFTTPTGREYWSRVDAPIGFVPFDIDTLPPLGRETTAPVPTVPTVQPVETARERMMRVTGTDADGYLPDGSFPF